MRYMIVAGMLVIAACTGVERESTTTNAEDPLETDTELGNWKGVIQTLRGTAVAGKALVVELAIPDGGRARAQLTPLREVDEWAQSTVTGLGDPPF